MLSGFIFFRKVRISLVKLILEKVTRYQDQSLRKNLLPALVSSFLEPTKERCEVLNRTPTSLKNTDI